MAKVTLATSRSFVSCVVWEIPGDLSVTSSSRSHLNTKSKWDSRKPWICCL
jgi:hypothetical protein